MFSEYLLLPGFLWQIVFLYTVITYYRNRKKLVERIEERHTALFEGLKRPSRRAWRTSIDSERALASFISRREYLSIDDSGLVELGGRIRKIRQLYFFLVAMLIASMILVAVLISIF